MWVTKAFQHNLTSVTQGENTGNVSNHIQYKVCKIWQCSSWHCDLYSTGAPERAALFQFLFTYYTSDFQYTSRTSSTEIFRWLCSRLKICVICRRRVLVEDFVEWSEIYHLLLNGYKTRERPTSERVQLDGPWLSWDRMSVWCT